MQLDLYPGRYHERDRRWMARLGASAWMVASDHGFLRQAARAALTQFAPPIG